MPDGVKVGTICVSPRGDWRMPSDAAGRIWLEEIEKLYNSGYQYRRRDIITFLNNFTTELDRSRSQAPKKYDPYDTYSGHFSMNYDKEVGSSIPRTVPGGPMNF